MTPTAKMQLRRRRLMLLAGVLTVLAVVALTALPIWHHHKNARALVALLAPLVLVTTLVVVRLRERRRS